MIDVGPLIWLQLLLLGCDVLCIIANFKLTQYFNYRRRIVPLNFLRTKDAALFVYFLGMTLIFIYISASDIIVIFKLSYWWATIPIVRGLVFRGPQALLVFWVVCELKKSRGELL